jgi:hypothetical protein
VFGSEIVLGYLAAWVVRKGRHVVTRVDVEVDAVLDTGLDRLHEVVTAKLVGDPALERFEAEAESGQVAERTQKRVALAIEDAWDDDETFAQAVQVALTDLERVRAGGTSLVSITQSAQGDQNVQVSDVSGSVTISFGGSLPPQPRG